MLQVVPSMNKELNSRIYKECGLGDKVVHMAFLLMEDDIAIGIATVKVEQTSTLKEVGILPAHRGRRNGDFLTRVMIYKLSMVSQNIRIGYQNSYFIPFGFVNSGDGMEAKVENITFPHNCCGGEC